MFTSSSRKLLELKWSAAARLVLLITDAPCHGRRYHDTMDDYPDGIGSLAFPVVVVVPRNPQCVCVFVCVCVCVGVFGDRVSSGDPDGLDPEAQLTEMALRGIDLYFTNLNDSTNKMVKVHIAVPLLGRVLAMSFSSVDNLQIWKPRYDEYGKASGRAFRVIPMGSEVRNFAPSVADCISSCISSARLRGHA